MGQVLIAKDKNMARKLSGQYKKGELRRIYHGIYTTDLTSPLELIVQKNWMSIISHIVSKGILSFRTACELRPIPFAMNQSIVFVTSSYSSSHKILDLK